MSPKGVHFIVEASGCGEVITDGVRLQDILVEAAKQANAQVWSVSFNRLLFLLDNINKKIYFDAPSKRFIFDYNQPTYRKKENEV